MLSPISHERNEGLRSPPLRRIRLYTHFRGYVSVGVKCPWALGLRKAMLGLWKGFSVAAGAYVGIYMSKMGIKCRIINSFSNDLFDNHNKIRTQNQGLKNLKGSLSAGI